MGVVNQIEWAKQLLERELNFKLVSTPDDFVAALDRAGQKRFEHCVTLTKMWARPYHRGQAKYQRLMRLLRLVTPDKVGKLRNPHVEAAYGYGRELDAELGDILRREP